MTKKTLIILCSFILFLSEVCAMNIAVTNDIKDIASTNKIGVRLTFDSKTQAVLCSTIKFSVDHPQIDVVDWSCAQRHISQFLSNFKRSKKVFPESFNCELKIKTLLQKNDTNVLIDTLKASNLHASCIAIEKNGRTRPINICCPIDIESGTPNPGLLDNTIDSTKIQNISSLNEIGDSVKNPSNYKKIEAEQGNVIVDKFKDLWTFLLNRIDKIGDKIDFFLLYLIIIVLTILFLLLVTRFSLMRAMLGGLLRFLIFACITMSYFFIKPFLVPYKFYVGLAALLILISFYYIFSAKSESAKDKLKSLLGFILASTAIPLILKAFLLFKHLG
ncbi:MAG: hypothetical protein US49_C0010G0008 [candidate division TM6 bacterium GW2011_GWF2_37_49]|nr:MAG: hypothetical protein US49_C0010G0008 [candidate division TM6 bacterium GW2011_GWF2_37_49]